MFTRPQLNSMTTFDRWFTWFVAALGTFSATLDASIVNVALPVLSKEFQAPLDTIQWVVSAYLLSTCASLPLFGWLGDRMQQSKLTAIGFLVRMIGAWLCAIAPDINLLILARIISALGASILMAISYSTVIGVFPPHQRAQSLGMIGSAVGLGSISGASIGGVLLSAFSWHAIFYISIPISLLGMVLAYYKIPLRPITAGKTVDFPGIILFAVFIVTLILGIGTFSKPVFNLWLCSGYLITALLSFIGFIKQEHRHSNPLIDLRIYEISAFTNGNIAGFMSFVAQFMTTLLVPYFLYNIMELSPGAIGMILTLWPIGMLTAAPLGGYLSDRTGKPLYFSLLGIALILLALIALIITVQLRSLTMMCIVNAMFGFGNGMFQAPNNASTMSAIPDRFHGVAGSLAALVRNLGMIIGTTLSVTVSETARKYYLAHLGTDSAAAFVFSLQASAAIGIIAAIICAYYTWQKKQVMAQ